MSQRKVAAVILIAAVGFSIYSFITWINYSADEHAALINDAAGRKVACTEWIVSYPGRVVIACEEVEQ